MLTGGHAVVARLVVEAEDAAALDAAAVGAQLAGVPAASTHATDWDRRYGGDQIWSGNPNGAGARGHGSGAGTRPSMSAP
ncbi:MAG: hypothetical protein R2690_02180 [Acidimicrobiales bacterium]